VKMIGKTISHYKILEKLGEGGMGVVFRAQDTKLGRKVAIKTLPEKFSQDRERLARFEREAKLLASLNHPNIATIFGLEESEGIHFLVLELVEGETLAERMETRPKGILETLKICHQIGEALEGAHEKGIIHRDLKPSNIKITPEEKVKVLDFGLAKAFETAVSGEVSGVDLSKSPTLTADSSRSGVILGTAAYMSPEQTRGKQLDKRTDIWSFGCVLYEMLTGKRAFKGETISDTIAAILEHEPDWKALPEATPLRIRNLLKRCLQKNPHQRLHDIADARIEIEETLSEISSPMQVSPRAESKITPVKGRRLIFSYVLLAIVSAVISGAAVWFLTRSPEISVKPNVTPVIVLMDSPHPDRVYDPETRKNRGTNADDLTDIVRDLPVVIHKETVSSTWHRENQVLKQKPDLVVIHRSCFFDDTHLNDSDFAEHLYTLADSKLVAFLGYIAIGDPYTKFLVYTRGFGVESNRLRWISEAERRFPSLKGRITAWHVPRIGEYATFRDPSTAIKIKEQIKSMLNLE